MEIGVDLGGSHVSAGLIKCNKILYKLEEDLEKGDISDLIVTLIKKLLRLNNIKEDDISNKIKKIGICLPGTVSNGIIVKSGNLNLKQYNILEKIKNEFNNIIIEVKNDAKCAAIAENELGSLRQYKDCLFLNVGTGIGGAAFLNSKLLDPRKCKGFEFGHMVIQKEGNICTCGKKGCFETYASIRALKQKVKETLNIKEDITGVQLKEIIENNQKNVETVLNEYLENLSIGIGNLIDIFEPDVICIGGSFSYYKELLLENLIEKLEKGNKTFNEGNLPKIITAKYINDSGILGSVL